MLKKAYNWVSFYFLLNAGLSSDGVPARSDLISQVLNGRRRRHGRVRSCVSRTMFHNIFSRPKPETLTMPEWDCWMLGIFVIP